MESRILVPNAIVFVFDPENKDVLVPEYDSGAAFAANATCVSVNTQADVDGEVTISFTTKPAATTTGRFTLIFDGAVDTPSGTIAVHSALGEKILQKHVEQDCTRIRIWVDDPQAASSIVVEILK